MWLALSSELSNGFDQRPLFWVANHILSAEVQSPASYECSIESNVYSALSSHLDVYASGSPQWIVCMHAVDFSIRS
jgi:hypothetical protein